MVLVAEPLDSSAAATALTNEPSTVLESEAVAENNDNAVDDLQKNPSATSACELSQDSGKESDKPQETDSQSGETCSRHEPRVVLSPKKEERYEGIVVGRHETYGFIKSSHSETRHFFHQRDCEGGAAKGAVVSFLLAHDESTGKDIAIDVKTIKNLEHNDRRKREGNQLGRFEGYVVVMAKGLPEEKLDNGLVSFQDEHGAEKQATFGTWRWSGGSIPNYVCVGDRVSFSLIQDKVTGALKATGITAVTDYKDAVPAGANEDSSSEQMKIDSTENDLNSENIEGQENNKEETRNDRLQGKIALLKKEFGFIRQANHPGDIFFHFSQLQGLKHKEIKVGDNVEFTLQVSQAGKRSASDVIRIPDGTVVFDRTSKYILQGVITSVPSLGKDYRDVAPGIIEFDSLQTMAAYSAGDIALEGLVSNPIGKSHVLFYASEMPKNKKYAPRLGDHVTFRININLAGAAAAFRASNPMAAAMGARKAVDVRAVRGRGFVETIQTDRHYGFIQFTEIDSTPKDSNGVNDDTPQKIVPLQSGQIFFHLADVLGDVDLAAGDEVEFIMHVNPKNGEPMAVRIRRISEHKKSKSPEDAKSSIEPPKTSKNSKKSSNTKKTKGKGTGTGSQHCSIQKPHPGPRMPDDTRGFPNGFRLKSLEQIDVLGGEEPCHHALFSGLKLKMPRVLRATAASFVPAGVASKVVKKTPSTT